MYRHAIIIPCFNEMNRFDFSKWSHTVTRFENVDWWFIDDGSVDRTHEIIKDLTLLQNAFVIRLNQNFGKANAIRLGMMEAINHSYTTAKNYYSLGFLDSDNAFDDFDISMLIEQTESKFNHDFQIVISSRVALSGRKIIRKKSRHYLGRIIYTLISWGWETSPYDTQSGFKLFKLDDNLKQCLNAKFNTRWFVDIELMMRISLIRNNLVNIWEVPLNYWKDVEGSKISFTKFPQIIFEIFRIRLLVKKTLKSLSKFN